MTVQEGNPRPWIAEFKQIGTPTRIISGRDYPENPLFKYFRSSDLNTIIAPQDQGRISSGDKKLLSLGFTGCSALILRQADGDSSALLHMVGNRLTLQQRLTIVRLAQSGPLDTLLLQGRWSWPITINGGELYRFALTDKRLEYQHLNDAGRFDVMYDPGERMASLYARGQEFQPKNGPHIVQIPF